MKKRQTIELKVILMLVAVVALALAILSSHAQAQVTCPGTATDSDGDGFTDAQECTGITLSGGNTFPGGTFIDTCAAGVSAADRPNCVDPNSKDLFVILIRATPSLIPSDPLKFISAPQAAGGLGIATHEISTTRTDRLVTSVSSQLAARITESPDTNGTNLGVSFQGMALDDGIVFTERIRSLVNSVCDATINTCVDSATGISATTTRPIPASDPLIQHFIRHTTAHEGCGHPCDIAPEYNARFGGNHYKAGTVVVMEQNVTYSKKGTKVTWYISTTYPDLDKAAANTLP